MTQTNTAQISAAVADLAGDLFSLAVLLARAQGADVIGAAEAMQPPFEVGVTSFGDNSIQAWAGLHPSDGVADPGSQMRRPSAAVEQGQALQKGVDNGESETTE